MKCSICKEPNHNKRTCAFKVTCSTCGNNGHTKKQCSFQIIYDGIPCLPKDIICIIQDYNAETKLYDTYKRYFSNQVLHNIPTIQYPLHRYYKTFIRTVLFPAISTYLQTFNSLQLRTEKIKVAIELYNYIYDFRWIFKNNPNTFTLSNTITNKCITLYDQGLFNMSLYFDMFY